MTFYTVAPPPPLSIPSQNLGSHISNPRLFFHHNFKKADKIQFYKRSNSLLKVPKRKYTLRFLVGLILKDIAAIQKGIQMMNGF